MRFTLPLLFALPVLLAAEGVVASGRVVQQTWETITLDGVPAGIVWSSLRETGEGASLKRVHVQDLKLSLRRGTSTVELRQEHGFEEDATGKVMGMFLRQYQGSKVFVELRGTVDPKLPDLLEIVREGRVTRQPWYEETWRPANLDQAPRKGTVRLYEPTYNRIVRYEATPLEPETIPIDGKRVLLTPMRLVPETLIGGNGRVTLSTVRWWIDTEGRVQRRELDMPGLGMLTLTRSHRGGTAAPLPVAPVVDVLERGLVPLARSVPRPYTTTAARLRLTLKDVDSASTALITDEHQTVKETRPGVLDVVVHPVGDQERLVPVPSKEYLGSSPMIDWTERSVQALAIRLGGPKDSWARAQARATWVRQNLRVDNSAPMMPAAQIARELRGDCRHAALLTTALCRAEGLPARTAIGLVYIERNRKPFLGFHMWTEVYAAGAWRGLDGTPGLGGVGALHVKVTDASWDKETTLAPMEPALKLVGKVNAEVVEIVE